MVTTKSECRSLGDDRGEDLQFQKFAQVTRSGKFWRETADYRKSLLLSMGIAGGFSTYYCRYFTPRYPERTWLPTIGMIAIVHGVNM